MGDFEERMQHLIDSVGHGRLEANVEVDQVYAKYQELGELNHPRGGEQHALRNSVYVPLDRHMGTLARSLITPDGSNIRQGMIDVAEDIGREYGVRAPVEFDNLRRSDHVVVTDNGAVIHDRPAEVGRLTEEQLAHRRRFEAEDFE